MLLAAALMQGIIKSTEKTEKFSRKNHEECLAYVIFTLTCCCGALLFTDLKFSALMTFSAYFQCLGFALLLLQVIRGRGTASISVRSLILYVILLSFRLYATITHEAYIPVDRSGDYLYQTIEATSLVLVIATVYKMRTLSENDGYPRADTLGIAGIIAVCGACALWVHPHLNHHFSADTSWAFSIYLEAVAMVPQLFLLTKLGGDVESLQGHYMACTFAARLAMLRVWAKCYVQIAYSVSETPGLDNLPGGYGVLFAHVLPCILLADFMYLYFRSFRSSKTSIVPYYDI